MFDRASSRPFSALLAAAAVLCAASCFNSTPADAANLPGSGRARLELETVEWGRLVDVLDEGGQLVQRDALVRDSLQDVPGSYRFATNPVTQGQTLTIHAAAGTAAFDMLLKAAENGRPAIVAKGLDGLPPFSMVPRNAAIRLQFSELLDPDSVNAQTIRIQVGDPPQSTLNARYVVRNGVQGGDGQPKGVVLLDPVISSYEGAQHGLPQNGLGFPPSLDSDAPSAAIRIPTRVDPDAGQFEVLMNRGRTRALRPTSSDPVETSSGGDPVVVRAFRSGNAEDPFRGFLLDNTSPDLVGQFRVSVMAIKELGTLRTLTYQIDSPACHEIPPKVGDVFELGAGLLVVTSVVDASNTTAFVVNGAVLEDPASFPAGLHGGAPIEGRLTSAYRAAQEALQLCWVRFSPEPEYGDPARGIEPYSSVTVSFSEAIDPRTVKSLDSFVVCSYLVDPPEPAGGDPEAQELWAARQYDPDSETVADYIDRQLGYQSTGLGSGRMKFGPVGPSADGRSFTMTPSSGFSDSHLDGDDLRFAVALRDGPDGIVDLAGNPLSFGRFVAGNDGQGELVAPGSYQPWPTDRYFALRFNSMDENGDGQAEYAGQYRFEPGRLMGRELRRFSRNADASNPYVAQRIQFTQGLMAPLNPPGSVLMTCWPYHTLGLGLSSQSEFNLDVEGLSWSPASGAVINDSFGRYSLALSHADRFPDDVIDPVTGFPKWPNSGLKRNADFEQNILGFPEHGETEVFDGPLTTSATRVFPSAGGYSYHPWNDFERTYTWRDTTIPGAASLDGPGYLGGKNGNGVPPDTASSLKVWGPNEVPSVGLPLLARFRCYPRALDFGANGFQVQLMVGSSPLPAFRVFSAGGKDGSGSWHQVLPDDRNTGGLDPRGGYNTNTGTPTNGYGPELYWQQVDFVVKVSRVHTHWFPFGGVPEYLSQLTLEPAPELLPEGTEVVVEVRAAELVVDDCGGGGPLVDANGLDGYGDLSGSACATVSTPTAWTTDFQSLLAHPSGVDFRYFQLRFSFVSNIEQELEPELDAFGMSWDVE